MNLFNVPRDFVMKFVKNTNQEARIAERLYLSLSDSQRESVVTLLDEGFSYRTFMEWRYAADVLSYTQDVDITKDILRAEMSIDEVRLLAQQGKFSVDGMKAIAMLSPELDKSKVAHLAVPNTNNSKSMRDMLADRMNR